MTGRDRRQGKPMHVFLCFQSKPAIVLVLAHAEFVFTKLAIVLCWFTSSLLPTIIVDLIVQTFLSILKHCVRDFWLVSDTDTSPAGQTSIHA